MKNKIGKKRKTLVPVLLFIFAIISLISFPIKALTKITPSYIEVSKIIDYDNPSYFLDLSSNSISLLVAGSINALKFIAQEITATKINSTNISSNYAEVTSISLENLVLKKITSYPQNPKPWTIVNVNGSLRIYDPNKGKWGSIRIMFGYDGFDNSGGGVWTKYINIPITTTPSEYAQYKIIIDATNVTVYSADGTQKAQGAVASDFWANVKSDGSDIRVFDQAKEQLYFWIEEWDYSNKKAVIWVNLTAGSSELNIAYGNPSASASTYMNGTKTFEFFDDFEGTELDTSKWQVTKADYSYSVTDGNLYYELTGGIGRLYIISTYTPNPSEEVYMIKMKISSIGGPASSDFLGGFGVGNENGGFDNKYIVGKDGNINKIAIHSWTGSHSYAELPATFDDYHTYTIIVQSNSAKVRVDDSDWVTASWSLTITDYEMIIGGQGNNYAKYLVDSVFVAKLADPADFGSPSIKEFQ